MKPDNLISYNNSFPLYWRGSPHQPAGRFAMTVYFRIFPYKNSSVFPLSEGIATPACGLVRDDRIFWSFSAVCTASALSPRGFQRGKRRPREVNQRSPVRFPFWPSGESEDPTEGPRLLLCLLSCQHKKVGPSAESGSPHTGVAIPCVFRTSSYNNSSVCPLLEGIATPACGLVRDDRVFWDFSTV